MTEHNTEKQRAEHPIFASRWLLYPINIGLILALVVYVGKFIIDDLHFFVSSFEKDSEQLKVLLLGLVDTAMVANLLIMVAQGSHQIFIRKIYAHDSQRPQWLDHIDSTLLKLKLSLSIAGITLVQLLKDFVDIEQIDWQVAQHRICVHLVCLVSAVAMAVIWKITHPSVSTVSLKEH